MAGVAGGDTVLVVVVLRGLAMLVGDWRLGADGGLSMVDVATETVAGGGAAVVGCRVAGFVGSFLWQVFFGRFWFIFEWLWMIRD